MQNLFSNLPGHRERHLKRKHNNPLFTHSVISMAEIEQARLADVAEAEAFLNHFRDLVKQAVDVKPNADADIILRLKEQLDKAYEQASGLPGDHQEIKNMLKRLLKAIMQAIWKGVGNDTVAQQKLEMEEQARTQHFLLLEQPLIADLIRPDSAIAEDELVPTLLSESPQALASAMQLFSPAQQIQLYQSAAGLLNKADVSHPVVQQAQLRLREMHVMLQVMGERPN